MKNKGLTITLCVIFLVAFSGIAAAWTSETEGRPYRFASGGGAAGYYVWQDEYGFHLWMLPGERSHTFSGTIRSDGRFYNIRGHHLDGGLSFEKYPDIKNRFWFESVNPTDTASFVFPGGEVECDSHQIVFRINTANASDGIFFQVSGAGYVGFDLQMDGRGIARKQIWYGGSSWHPETYKFKFENR